MNIERGESDSGIYSGDIPGAAIGSGEPNKLIRFISLVAESAADDFNAIKDIIKTREFVVDFVEFKITNTKVERRLIKPSQKDGPRERIEIEEKVDINSNFKYLRQLASKTTKEVNNTLLVQFNQIKGFPCSLPLVFSELFKAHRSVLVHGITDQVYIQLISKPDLTFKRTDDLISKNPQLRKKILERAGREKTMQAVARELKDFTTFPADIKIKLNQMAVGNKVVLTDEEAINIILISDLYSRYSPLLQTFERDIANRNQSVAALASQFAEMTRGIRTERLLEAFKNYLVEEGSEGEVFTCQNNLQFFSYYYKRAQLLEEKRIKVGDQPLTRADMFAILRSMVILARSQIDPGLWNQCLFFFKQDDLRTSKTDNISTVDILLKATLTKLKAYHSASSLSLLEIHLIHNIHRYITGKKVLITQSDLSQVDFDLIRSTVVPILYQPDSNDSTSGSIRLMLGMESNLQSLINPIHTVGRVYGFLMGRRLRESVQRFLKPGLRELLSRFGKNFFSIFYEMAVQEAGLPISRVQFAKWLQAKDFFQKPEEYGFIPNNLETHFDRNLNAKALMESGISCFPITYSEQDFKKEFESARFALKDFMVNIQKEAKGFAGLLSEFLAKGNYNLRSTAFREYIKNTTISKSLTRLFILSCSEIKLKLKELAVNKKLILKIPLAYEPILLIEHFFQLPVDDQTIQVHLIAIPVESEKDLEPASRYFSKNLIHNLRKGKDPLSKELYRANRILNVYQTIFMNYQRLMLISILDRQINNSILKIRQQKDQTPNHIRYHFENYEKLFVGNTKHHNLGKLVQYNPAKSDKDVVHSLLLNQILQAMVLYKSAIHKLRDFRGTIEQIQMQLERVSDKIEDDDSLTYLKQIAKFKELIVTPIEDLNENVLNLITQLANKIDKVVRQSQSNKGILTKLHQQWKKQNPSLADKFNFYEVFLRKDSRSHDQKLFLEIAKSREILLNIKQRKCLIFFPDNQQEEFFHTMMDVAAFLIEREFETNLYVEISELNKEQIETLSQVFYPGNFFRLDRLKPVPLSR